MFQRCVETTLDFPIFLTTKIPRSSSSHSLPFDRPRTAMDKVVKRQTWLENGPFLGGQTSNNCLEGGKPMANLTLRIAETIRKFYLKMYFRLNVAFCKELCFFT